MEDDIGVIVQFRHQAVAGSAEAVPGPMLMDCSCRTFVT
jgi:hypothetical protein